MLRLRYSGLALLAAAACSPVHDPSNVPDAPIDSTDMRPPMIESSNPAMNATKVSILQPITVFMDEALDPDSVNATTVKLGYFANFLPNVFPTGQVTLSHGPVPKSGVQYVKGTVSYDAAGKKISFVPAAPLPYGYQFALELDVKDTAGIAFKGALTFTTFINSQTKTYFFNGTNGNPGSWIGNPVDMNGRTAKRVGGSAAGPDTIWFTSDDPRNQHFDFKMDADGRTNDERNYNPGTDNNYDTPDDTLASCVRYTYNAQKQMTERVVTSQAGPDATLCTADDVPNLNSLFNYMDGTMIGWVIYTAPGTDNTWRTPDDRCAVLYDYEYDAQGNKTREIYKNCGADSLPRTADDTFNYYWGFEYDASGYPSKKTFYNGAGTDTMWLTPDDSISQVERWIRNDKGLVTDYYISFGVGTDNMWGTADDSGNRTSTKYNAKNLAEEVTTYNGPGTDGMWGTPDDVTSSYQTFSYDEYGNRTDSKIYAAGADAVWKTPDDRITQDLDFDLAH